MSAQAPGAASLPPMQALNVRLQFGGVVALNDVSLEIRDDELLAIIRMVPASRR